MVLDSSTVITPSFPTFFIASAITSPMVGIAVGRDAPYLRNHVAGDRFRKLLNLFDRQFDRLVNAALNSHGVRARGHRLHAFAENRLGQNGGRGGAVARHIGSLGCYFAHHLGAHVLERILQLDFLGHAHAVFRDGGSAELFLENDVSSFGSQGDLYCFSQLVDAAQNCLAGLITVNNLFCHK